MRTLQSHTELPQCKLGNVVRVSSLKWKEVHNCKIKTAILCLKMKTIKLMVSLKREQI